MTDETKTCQVIMHNGEPCGRNLYDSEKCICHCEDPDKDVAQFNGELFALARHKNVTQCFDYTGFVFPHDGASLPGSFECESIFRGAVFLGDADFAGKEFAGDVSFEDTVFERECSFRAAQFEASAYFHSTQFHGEVTFREAMFSPDGKADFDHVQFEEHANFFKTIFVGNVDFDHTCFCSSAEFTMASFALLSRFTLVHFHSDATFQKTIFDGEVQFRNVRFMGTSSFTEACFKGATEFRQVFFVDLMMAHGAKISGYLMFRGATFGYEAYFTSLRLAESAKVVFHTTSLDRCRFLGSKVEHMEFTDVAWPSRRKLLGRDWFYRKAVYDELNPQGGQSWEQVADIYRGLQEYYHQRNRYQEAGGFYIAEHDINRKVNRKLPYRVSTRLYRMASIYGESYLRSLLWLAFILVLSPAVFLWGGIDLSPHIDPSVGPVDIVSYQLSLWPQDCFLLTDDFKEAFNANISFITLNRSELTGRLPHTGQRALAGLEMVLVVILVSFVVLALRRWFKRKSF